jgi:taurine dioxygenase
MQNSTIDVHLTSKDSGAEISGVDLARPLAEPTYREIRHLLADRGVVFFREQELTPEQLLALGKQFGEIHISKLIAKVPGHPLVAEVRKEPEQTRNTGGNWHSDHAYVDKPPLGSILLARELPPLGGDTMFANMCAAYDSLSDGLKKTLDGLKAVHAKKKALDNSNLSAERKVGTKERARRSPRAIPKPGAKFCSSIPPIRCDSMAGAKPKANRC